MKHRKQIIIALLLTACATIAQAQYKTNSVLASGQWWKIGIANEGIYRLSVSDIPALEGSNTADIAIFGHHGGVMDMDNSAPRIDDLEEIAISIHDANGNGVVDNDDYVVFYGSGPDRWNYNTSDQQFQLDKHPYASANYLFLTIQPGSHKRITLTEPQTATGEAIVSAHYLQRHEQDLTNTHRTGQIWVGEKFFSSTTQRSITLQLPAISSAIKVRYALASISKSASSFAVKINGSSFSHYFNNSSRYIVASQTVTANTPTLEATLKYTYNENFAEGYLDYIEVDAVMPMKLDGASTIYRMPRTDGIVHTFQVANANSDSRVWDVSDFNNVKELEVTHGSNSLSFNAATDTDRSFLIFSSSAFTAPLSIDVIGNQDLHGNSNPDMVIVCHSSLLPQAQRLASLHSILDEMTVMVATQDEVFNEFSSGQRDPMAIRELLRMFRKRAVLDNSLTAPKHLLLFGKGTYDNRNLLGNDITDVVTYQPWFSFNDDGSGSISTDDMFTFLDDNETGSIYESLDVSVGRLPAKDISEATHLVDKIEHYMTRSDLLDDNIRGDWRNTVALLADDADGADHLGDTSFTWSSEMAAKQINNRYPHLTVEKIYADAFVQQSGADGSFYPDVNNALKKRINYGCLLLNYIGHGSSQYIGTERYMTKTDISTYTNTLQLPFFITSTCTFGRFDDPMETCGAEEFLLSDGAGIGCLAATRPISHIQSVNTSMIMMCLDPENTIGEGIRKAKNLRPTTQALSLMGDPALKLSHPKHRVVVTAVNGNAVDSSRTDTALVLSTVTVEGEIRDQNGELVSDFNGHIYPEVYDRPKKTWTLANDNEGYEVAFMQQNNLLYKGSATVSNGRFSYHFIVPKDVAYTFDRCRLAHYAKSATDDATGSYQNLYLGGFDQSAMIEDLHPEMSLYINDTNFRNEGITGPDPTLLVLLHDSLGINSVGSGLGHDITAMLDQNPNSIITLNDLYEPDINDDRCGTIRYNFSSLAPGRHTIRVKAWNIFNYSVQDEISFVVKGSDETYTNLQAMPNPAIDRVWLRLETNNSSCFSSAELDIFDIHGRLIAKFIPPVNSGSFVVGPVCWDLTNGNGNRVIPGVYLARITAITSDGNKIAENCKIIVK